MNIIPSMATKVLDTAPRDPKLYGKVAVLMGGYAEYDVSLNSGQEVLQALVDAGINAHKVLVQPDNNWFPELLKAKYDRVFIALHGKIGEDGTVQAALELAGLPYTGSKVTSSVLAMDKLRAKQIWQTLEIPVIPYQVFAEDTNPQELAEKFGFPLAVKAACSGSTLGITKVKTLEELPKAYAYAREYDDTVLVEPWIAGMEYTVPILDKYAMPSIRIEPQQEYYDYVAKYIDDNTGFYCPSGLSDADEMALRTLAEQVYHSLDCEAFGRVDFIRDEAGKFWVLEVNTIPGLTTHSLVPRSVKAMGYTFTDFVITVLATTL